MFLVKVTDFKNVLKM